MMSYIVPVTAVVCVLAFIGVMLWYKRRDEIEYQEWLSTQVKFYEGRNDS